MHRRVYIGVCGAAKWAGEVIDMGKGNYGPGLGLFGKGVNIAYDFWWSPTRSDNNTVEITDSTLAAIDTRMDHMQSAVLINKKDHDAAKKKERSQLKASEIQQLCRIEKYNFIQIRCPGEFTPSTVVQGGPSFVRMRTFGKLTCLGDSKWQESH